MISRKSNFWILMSILALLGVAAECEAHNLKIFAAAQGDLVSGQVYFAGGGRLKNAMVLIGDLEGNKIDEVETDENGEFSFKAEPGIALVLKVATAEGHAAEWTVGAEELLPAQPSHDATFNSDLTIGQLGAQINALREQIAHNEERLRLRDLIGAIGYLFGAAGIAFYFLGVKRQKR